MDSVQFSLTRYLYIKDDVYISLIVSIFEKDFDKALFWASEIYYSMYEEELILFIETLYNNFYRSNNPHLGKLIKMGVSKYKEGIHILATLLKNLTSKVRTFTLSDFIENNPMPEILTDARNKETKIWIFCNANESEKYKFHNINERNYNILKKVCIYETVKIWGSIFECLHIGMNQKELYEAHIDKWLYYASFSPLWELRINNYGGIIHHETKTVTFEEEEQEEEFYNAYYYEIDEQPKNILISLTHSSIIEQSTMNEFYKKYEPNLKRRIVKLKRVNNKSGSSK